MDGGSTKRNISGWTTDTLHSHVIMLIDERDRRYEQRFQSQLSANEKALEAAKIAIDKAEMAVEKRLENTNEWRAAMNDRDAKLIPRMEFDSVLNSWSAWRLNLEKEQAEVKNRVTAIETRSVTWSAAILIFFTIVQIAMFWLLAK